MTYATLAQLRKRNQIADADTGDDQRYREKLRVATAAIDDYCNRTFQPIQATRKFDYSEPTYLHFRYQDLLVLTSITDSYHSLPAGNLIMLGMEDTTSGPYYALQVIPTLDFFQWFNSPKRAISIAGVWGYHEDYANAWRSAGINGTLTDTTTTTITFSADPTTVADSWGDTPAISAGDLIQIESEWMPVMTTSGTTGRVLRGANGTTAAAHAAKAISVYKPMPQIVEACLTWAAYLVTRDDADDNGIKITGAGDKIIPPGFPKRIFDLLNGFENVRVS